MPHSREPLNVFFVTPIPFNNWNPIYFFTRQQYQLQPLLQLYSSHFVQLPIYSSTETRQSRRFNRLARQIIILLLLIAVWGNDWSETKYVCDTSVRLPVAHREKTIMIIGTSNVGLGTLLPMFTCWNKKKHALDLLDTSGGLGESSCIQQCNDHLFGNGAFNRAPTAVLLVQQSKRRTKKSIALLKESTAAVDRDDLAALTSDFRRRITLFYDWNGMSSCRVTQKICICCLLNTPTVLPS